MTIGRMDHERGVTLIELMVTLSVLAILTSLTAPSMQSFFERQRLISASEEIFSNLQQARIEAITRSTPVFASFNDGNATDGWQATSAWQYGIGQVSGCNPTITDKTSASACYLTIDNGDGSVNAANDNILNRYSGANYNAISLTSFSDGNNDNQIKFESRSGTAESSTITLQSASGSQMRIVVGRLGQISLCSPSGTSHVGGYRNC